MHRFNFRRWKIQNFKAGKNPYLSVRKDGTVHVKTPKQEEVECLPLKAFFPARKYIPMIEVLATQIPM